MQIEDPVATRRVHLGLELTAQRRWHPFDSAAGTIVLGVALTFVLVIVLRLLGG
jgi:hypothetical protein